LAPHEEGLLVGTLLKPIKPVRLLEIFCQQLLGAAQPDGKRNTNPFTLPRNLGQEHPLRVLIAEDNPVNRKVALLLMRRMAYEPEFAHNGAEALAAIERSQYDVVFMDIEMPVLAGLESTRELGRRYDAPLRPRIIGMSAHASVDDRRKYMLAGMDDYLTKPVRPDELAAALRRVSRQLGIIEDSKQSLETLLKSYGRDAALEIIVVLATELEEQRAALKAARATGDTAALHQVASTLKASAQMLHSDALSLAWSRIEQESAQSEIDSSAAALRRYEQLVLTLKYALVAAR
jgi:CheY-like chemotaxis protein/HPt (histidine-containing phosphotransfer) domain-containing protein